VSNRRGGDRKIGGPLALVLVALAAGATAGLAGAAAPTSNYRQDVLASAPSAYWRLGETSGATAADETGTNPGTYSNVSLNQPSALACGDNASASFDGTQSYVRAPASPSLDMTTAVTVEFWAKRRTISSTYQVVVGKPGNGQSKFENYGLWQTPSNRYTAYFGNGTTYVAVSTPVITDTNWHYIVATNNGPTVRMYLDGVLKEGTSTTLQLTANTQPLNIGRANSNNNFFNGWLDEVAIYPTALPAQVILAHYNRALDAP
jgi:large repetitive protein